MKSKTSSFKRTLIISLWKRFWPLFGAYFAIWLLLLPLSLGNALAWNLRNADRNSAADMFANIGQTILNDGVSAGTVMSIIFCVLVAMAAFSYLYNARSVSMMGSLPIKREGIFLSQFIAGLSMMLMINVVIFLISLAVGESYGAKAGFDAAHLWQWLGIVCLENVFFFGFAALCASFTGNIIVLPLVYFVLNFTVWGVKEMISGIMGYFTYGYSGTSNSFADWFSPAVKILEAGYNAKTTQSSGTIVVTAYSYSHWGMLAVYAAVGIIFALLAMYFIKNRRMESAGDVVALLTLKPIFKYCMAGGCALVMGLLLFSTSGLPGQSVRSFVFMVLFMLIGAFIGYFASEMMMQKTLRVFSAKWLGFGLSCAVIAVLMFCLRCDVFGYEKYVPNAGEVESIYLGGGTVDSTVAEPQNIQSVIDLHKSLIDHKQTYASIESNDGSYRMSINYSMKDGSLVQRRYEITNSANSNDVEKMQEIANTREAILSRKKLDYPVNLSTILNGQIDYFDRATKEYRTIQVPSDQMYDLYTNCIVPDINDLTLGRVWYITDDTYRNRVLDCTIQFNIQQEAPKQYEGQETQYYGQNFSTTLTLDAKRTYQWIKDHYPLDLLTMGESTALQSSNGKSSAKMTVTTEAASFPSPEPSSQPDSVG